MTQTGPLNQRQTEQTDAQLKAAVLEELSWVPSLDSTNIGVAVNAGAIILSGQVESFPEKYLAEKAALHVRGVTALAEEITVHSRWAATSDVDIAREVAEALARAVDVPGEGISATVHDHTITLTGHVAWHFQRQAAHRAVRYIKGVRGVVNRLQIRPDVSPGDIRTAVTDALVRSAKYDAEHITVDADLDGRITLGGSVRHSIERRDAEHAAWSAPGITDVVNHIRVTG